MADFCQEHGIEMWGRDVRDLAGLISIEDVEKGMGAVVLCESCGIILVDHNGKRIDNEKDVANED